MAVKRITGDWRTRILLLFSAILIGTLLVQVMYVVPYIQNRQLDDALEHHEHIAINIVRDGNDDLEHILDELTNLANQSVFRNMEIENQTDYMFQYLTVEPDISTLTVLNSTGWFVSGTVDDFELYYTTMSYDWLPFFYVPFEQGEPNFGDPYWYSIPDVVGVSISVPITSNAGEIVGVLMGSMNLGEMIETISNYPLDEDIVAYLVDQRGTVLAHSDIDLFALENGPLSLNYSSLHLIEEFAEHKTTIARMHDHNSSTFFGIAMALETTPWVMVVEAPLSSIVAEGNAMVTNLWSLNLLLFGATMIIAMVFAQMIVNQQEQKTRELENAQDRLARQERLATLGKLSGGIGHELRNPLAVIRNAIYYLKMVVDSSDSEVKETLDILETEVTTSSMIITSLLDYAKPKPPTRMKTDLQELTDSSISRVEIPENVEVVANYDDDIPTLLVDPTQMSRVIINLGRNAIQAMPEGGKLTIHGTVSEPGWVSLSLTDTGVGMSEETKTQLFEPLFTTKAKGIGLGLVIVKTLVEGNGGTIEIESEEGKGSTFTVKLPVVQKEVG
ncbi:MAG: ATP-binding protein [Candidatus Thorarchaeota archaeon]